ncbi:ABC transporter substrate-binding protein [Alkalibacillus haloalkaliphilus]|uniref:ABC transporter substrate-binding protein n=1 Tax=Alkalibacillus haloalkaliphilus TaxID=94136 RepID=A0A511W4X1_9BACI|nr:ABC transporter substrate-binding protein [Alkalibacillus haloalkaliphilus]GEN46120.1 ABC transporter substrate-binding protein [Alkalibacillus haloalkaliphilus]
MRKQSLWTKLFLVLMLVLAVGLAACQQDEGETNESTNEPTEESTGESVTLTDQAGEEVTIEGEVDRIVSVIPSATEIVYAVGAGDQVVGVSEWADYPEEVFEVEETVGDMNLNIEKIVELEPDVVIADLNNADDLEAMRSAGLNVVTLGSQSLEGVYEDIELVGQATGQTEQAEQIVNEMEMKVEEVTQAVNEVPEEERKSVWMEVGPELYSGGEGSFLHELITLAGGENIIADQEGWPQVSEEVVIERNPDVIITTYGYYTDDVAESVLQRSGWDSITAVENEEVYDIHNDTVSRPGPRLVDGLEEIASILYPDYVE